MSREEFLAGLSRGSPTTTTAKVLQAADVSGVNAGGDAPPRASSAVSPAVSPPAVLKGAQGEEQRKIKVYVAKDEIRTPFRIKRTAPVPHFTCFTTHFTCFAGVLALLVQKYECWREGGRRVRRKRTAVVGAHFTTTCFTSTKVQILTRRGDNRKRTAVWLDVTLRSTCFTAASLLLPLYHMQVQKLLDMYCKQKGVDAVDFTFHYAGKELVGSSTPGICSIRQHTPAYVSMCPHTSACSTTQARSSWAPPRQVYAYIHI